ncbi:MAG: hypothetical protein HOD92_20885 [Deltaproteobacteria bacterium]|jgi:uncharacterized protein|nr:hypothetical protein [Deltaproteobacteria bacterium]MBT4527712.1 hypothetical protein [Deltaproteobacteria bacterium]
MKIIRKKDLTTSQWSGGTTTQLYIYPKQATYQKLNFDFRLSSARVEIEESTFTKLKGISRIIMVLEGETFLTHKQRDTVYLKKFNIDHFEGDWDTSSKGKVVDFNLMLNQNYEGNLSHLILTKNRSQPVQQTNKNGSLIIYLYQGLVYVIAGEKEITMGAGDTLVLNSTKDKGNININAPEASVLIISEISKKKDK